MQPVFLLFLALLCIAITFTHAEEVVTLTQFDDAIASTPAAETKVEQAALTVDELKAKEKAFLDEVAQRPGIYKLKSGMLVEILESSNKPDAKSPTPNDDVDLNYTGYFMDGRMFDRTNTVFTPNEAYNKGWTEAMQLMAEGDKWKLYLPHYLAYGESGFFSVIPPVSPLVFEFEILEVAGGKSVTEARKMFNASLVKPNDNQEL